MKHLIFVILFLVCSKSVGFSQPTPGAYIVDNNLDKLVGSWNYNYSGINLNISLKKIKYHYPAPFNFDTDVLVGCHTLTKNDVMIESSMQYINTSSLTTNFTLLGKTDPNNSSLIRMTFLDLTKKKVGQLTLSLKPGMTDQLIWNLTETEGVKIRNPNNGFTVPTNVVLLAP